MVKTALAQMSQKLVTDKSSKPLTSDSEAHNPYR